MTTAAFIATALLALVAFGFALGAALFLIKGRKATTVTETGKPLPKAAILLALRGTDPYLGDCLRSLLDQDYPDYDLHIVVDSDDDPAWKTVTRVIGKKRRPNIRAASLRDPPFTCSRKCSALLQMLAEIDPDVKVAALVDGDVVPHRGWLRQLAAPLADESVGVVFGIPWYFPREARFASLVRKVCWIPATVLMALCGWTWGGTAALPARIFRHPELAARWSRAVSSDAPVQGLVRNARLGIRWVPSLVMPNFEEGRFESLYHHLARSLSTSRLYVSGWLLTFLAVGIATGAFLLATTVFAAAVLSANAVATGIAAAGLAGYVLLLGLLLLLVERRVRDTVRDNGVTLPPLTPFTLTMLPLAIPVAHAFYLAAALKARNVRALTWRGVHYEINGGWDIRPAEPAAAIRSPAGSRFALHKHQPGTGD